MEEGIMNYVKMVKTRPGRIIIHFVAIKKTHNIYRHVKGIMREITLQGKASI
jgi:hypothetical protein